jgi:CHASE3 domain sensor protein
VAIINYIFLKESFSINFILTTIIIASCIFIYTIEENIKNVNELNHESFQINNLEIL